MTTAELMLRRAMAPGAQMNVVPEGVSTGAVEQIVIVWCLTAGALGGARQRVPCAISVTSALHHRRHEPLFSRRQRRRLY
jgi:hypothetical protein